MTIEELPVSGDPGRATESDWLTTLGALGAGIAIGMVVILAFGTQAVPAPSPGPTGSAAIAPPSQSPKPATPHPTPTPANLDPVRAVPSVRQPLNVDGVAFSFSVPSDGWSRFGGLYVSKNTRGSQGAEAMIFWARHPVGEFARLCGFSEPGPIGYTAAQVAEGLATEVAGTELISGPTDVTVGGLAAKQVVLFVRDDQACGPGYFYTWEGEDLRGGSLWGGNLLGDTITIWIIEIDGERFIITAETHLNADARLLTEVQQIIDSIEFGPQETGTDSAYTSGRHATTVDGTAFSFEISTRGWEPYQGQTPAAILISKSIRGPQGAEEMIYWAGYPNSVDAHPCGVLQDPGQPPSPHVVASRVATAPGTDLVTGPEDLSVGGHPAVHVVVKIREASECDPGFFYSWERQQGGAMWTETPVGATIRVWVVEVDGGLLFLGGATVASDEVGPLSGAVIAGLDEEIQRIIDSIEFD